jgi:hypothetical protein
MAVLRKGLVASATAAAALISGGLPVKNHESISVCNPDYGYVISTQKERTDSIVGTYDIRSIHAQSFTESGKIIVGADSLKEASLQLNAYLIGEKSSGKKAVYWVQNVMHFVYHDGEPEQSLSSELFKYDNEKHGPLQISHIKGNGAIYTDYSCSAQPKKAKEGITYIYSTEKMPTYLPQNGYLEMSANVKDGRIHVEMDYWNSKYGKKYAFDTMAIGEKSEFKKAYFFSNSTFDAEIGFGGDSCGSVSYFSDTDAYLGLYYGKAGKYVTMRYANKSQPATAERSIDLSCRYFAAGYMQFYAYEEEKSKALKAMMRPSSEKLLASN